MFFRIFKYVKILGVGSGSVDPKSRSRIGNKSFRIHNTDWITSFLPWAGCLSGSAVVWSVGTPSDASSSSPPSGRTEFSRRRCAWRPAGSAPAGWPSCSGSPCRGACCRSSRRPRGTSCSRPPPPAHPAGPYPYLGSTKKAGQYQVVFLDPDTVRSKNPKNFFLFPELVFRIRIQQKIRST